MIGSASGRVGPFAASPMILHLRFLAIFAVIWFSNAAGIRTSHFDVSNCSVEIFMRLTERPLNTHQLSKELELDYKAIQHHMKVLEKNNLVTKVGDKYGAIFHLSNFLEINIRALDEAIEKLERKMNSKKVYY